MPTFSTDNDYENKSNFSGSKDDFSSTDESDCETTFEEFREILIDEHNFEEAKLILNRYREYINEDDGDGETLLHSAAQCGDVSVVKFLLKYDNIRVNCIARDGISELDYATPLHYAAYYGHIEVVKLLIRNEKIKLNIHDGAGLTPLQEAMVKDYCEIMTLLLEAGADVECPTTETSDPGIDVAGTYIPVGSTALQMAVILQHTRAAKLLLQHEANIEVFFDGPEETLYDEYNYNPEQSYANQGLLDIAIENEDFQTVELLCSYYEILDLNTVDAQGLTPFFKAVIADNTQIAELLLSYEETEVDYFHEQYVSPFYQAVLHDNLALVKKMLSEVKEYIDINVKDSDNLTPLHVACINGFTKIAHLLIRTPGVDLNAEDINNFTPLDYAIKGSHAAIVEHLRRKRGVDPNKKLQDTGRKKAKQELMEEFLYEYADDILEEDRSISLVAAEYAAEETLNKGFDYRPFAHADEGLAPVHLAAKYGDVSTFKAVLNFSKIDLEATDDNQQETAAAHLAGRGKKRNFDDYERGFSSEEEKSEEEIAYEAKVNQQKSAALEAATKRRKLEEGYTSNGSSSDDSDDEFKPKPYIVPPVEEEILHAQKKLQIEPPADKKILIAEYRGVTFKSSFFSKEQRRKKYEEIDSKDHQTIHSAASYELAGYDADNEKLLQSSKQIHAVMRSQEKRSPYEVKNSTNQPHSVADQDSQHYVNSQSRYMKDLQEHQAGTAKKSQQAKLTQRFNGLTTTQNPYLSFGDLPRQPAKFGCGLNGKYEPSKQTVPRLRKTTGKTKRPYIGYIVIALFTLEELKAAGARHVPTLIKQKRIGVKYIYRHAHETTFLGFVPKENVVEQVRLRIPSFEKYKPHFNEKYGLSEEKFNEFRKQLQTTSEKSIKRQEIYKKIIEKIIEFLEPQLINLSIKKAHELNAVLMYQDPNGGYTAALPKIIKQPQIQQSINEMAESFGNITLEHHEKRNLTK